MSLLEINGLTHSFGDNLLYKQAQIALNKGEHMGIVGQNGAGKSTLIQICTGQLIPDAGRISWQPNITVGYLDQYAKINPSLTMRDFLESAFSAYAALEQKIAALYVRAAAGETNCLKQAAALQERLEQSDFYLLGTRIEQIAGGLGLLPVGLERPISQMSGGQRAKVILAKLLLEKPDVLLLDEPTNFLDREQVAWLADYLSGLENSFMVVSHDFSFLDKICNRICDIDNNRIAVYYGTYREFLKKKSLLREDYMRQYSRQQQEIRQTEEFIRKNIAGRKSRMARGRQKQLNRLEKMDAPSQKEIKPAFHFPELPLTNTEHLSVYRLVVGYGKPLLPELNFHIKGGEKAVITGLNGIGKSTLLKTLVGQLRPLGGGCQFSSQVKAGYFEQDLTWPVAVKTPLDILSEAYPTLTSKEVRTALARCGISGKHALQAVGTLSGGEQAKVKLCLLTLTPCNFLILDEPTNHLDIQAKLSLKKALSDFSGTILLISHEADFYEDWVKKQIRL